MMMRAAVKNEIQIIFYLSNEFQLNRIELKSEILLLVRCGLLAQYSRIYANSLNQWMIFNFDNN